MKILYAIVRFILGLAFTFFGLNGLFHWMKGEMPAGPARDFGGAMASSHYMDVVSALMVLCGLLFLSGQFVPLALVMIAPVLVNIILFHVLFGVPGVAAGLVLSALWVVLAWGNRSALSGILRRKAR